MAEKPEAITHEAVRDPTDQEWLIYIFGQQPNPEVRSKHQIQKAPAKFREYEKDKKYFDPRVVSLGPGHHGEDKPREMEKHKIMAVKQFVDESRGMIFYEKVKELTGVLKEFYDAEVVGKMSDDVFARMMFLDGCFVLHFIENQLSFDGRKTKLEISNDLIPLIIRDMFLMENQLPFEVLDALMNLRRGSSNLGPMSLGKQSIVLFIVLKILKPMGFYSLNSHRLLKWCAVVDGVEQYDSPLHLLDILRTILLDFPTKAEMRSYNIPRNFGSVMEIIGIGFEDRRVGNVKPKQTFQHYLPAPFKVLNSMNVSSSTVSNF